MLKSEFYRSQYFSDEEFACKCGECGSTGQEMDTFLVTNLDKLRKSLGAPIVITSGYRCPEHNKAVGGSETSSHLNGSAVDIACDSSHYRFRLLMVLDECTISRVGLAKTFIHLDTDQNKRELGLVWLYQ